MAEPEIACPKCGGRMWDNRLTKTNPKAPDFKCRNGKFCDGVRWPEEGGRNGPSASLGLGPYREPQVAPGGPDPLAPAPAQEAAIVPTPGRRAVTVSIEDIKLLAECIEAGVRASVYGTSLLPKDSDIVFTGDNICSLAAILFIETRKSDHTR